MEEPQPVSTPKGVRYDLAVYIYPDGHGNITSPKGKNVPVADAEEAITYFAKLWKKGRNKR